MDLKAFLNPVKEENIKCVISDRFLDENGKGIEWELKAISSKKDEELRKECTSKVQVKKGRRIDEIDTNRYICLLTVESVVFPNLRDKELQDAYDVMGSEDLLKAMLKPGEFTALTAKVSEINGFDVSMDELAEEAKN